MAGENHVSLSFETEISQIWNCGQGLKGKGWCFSFATAEHCWTDSSRSSPCAMKIRERHTKIFALILFENNNVLDASSSPNLIAFLEKNAEPTYIPPEAPV